MAPKDNFNKKELSFLLQYILKNIVLYLCSNYYIYHSLYGFLFLKLSLLKKLEGMLWKHRYKGKCKSRFLGTLKAFQMVCKKELGQKRH